MFVNTNLKGKKIFISYAREDIKIAENIYSFLKDKGFDPWLDLSSQLPGEVWKSKIIETINECYFFLVILSENSVSKRGIIQLEIKEALLKWKEKLADDIFIIPVKVDNVDVRNELSTFHWIDLSSNNALELIVSAIVSGFSKYGIEVYIKPSCTPNNYLDHSLAHKIINERSIYNKNWNPNGTYFNKELRQVALNGDVFVFDSSNMLLWEYKSCGEVNFKNNIPVDDIDAPIKNLNNNKKGGFCDWRIPTLEEVSTLFTPEPFYNLYRLPIFSNLPDIILTSDKSGHDWFWCAIFYNGSFWPVQNALVHVKAVRSVNENDINLFEPVAFTDSQFNSALSRLKEIDFDIFTFQTESEYFSIFNEVAPFWISLSILDEQSLYNSLVREINNNIIKIPKILSIPDDDFWGEVVLFKFSNEFISNYFIALLEIKLNNSSLKYEVIDGVRSSAFELMNSSVAELEYAERYAIKTRSAISKYRFLESSMLVATLLIMNSFVFEAKKRIKK